MLALVVSATLISIAYNEISINPVGVTIGVGGTPGTPAAAFTFSQNNIHGNKKRFMAESCASQSGRRQE